MNGKLVTFLTVVIVLELALLALLNPFGPWNKEKGTLVEDPSPVVKPAVTIGSKSFTEQYLLMKMTGIWLRENGFAVKEIIFKGSTNIRSALEAGVIDQYWEYPNTARIYYQQQPGIPDAEEAFRTVAEQDEKVGLRWLQMTPAINSSWTMLIKKELAEQYGIRTISDLSAYAKGKQLHIATNSEFLIRGDGIEPFQQKYGFTIPRENIIVSETKLFAQAVKEARVQAAVGFASDGRIIPYGLVELEDDLHYFPPYNPAPVVTAASLKQNPQIEPLLNRLTGTIEHDKFMAFLYRADVQHEDVTELARQYLVEAGLIRSSGN
ncbi:glycine betaine ABC transporter substrate-binding protein [Paenibacillus thalictri]|uniref:Glycine/betaine ABC transporter substrate-binding protein n=1 Tax=Paenibacillus thalictri TaxID=2527873 RepID=A0A4Q9DVD5_9BACL|nr:glycine betaine ABC transporter substrate-binding protein [Paenibacillus thalictri]TBL80997.1 glycine/betaine ABC transporter substrate-binding protein [Paenibacillus thalictri]